LTEDELENGWTLTHSCGVAALCVGVGLGEGLGLVLLLGVGLGLDDGFFVGDDEVGFGLGSDVLLLGLGLAESVLGPGAGVELDGAAVGLPDDPLGDGSAEVLVGVALPEVLEVLVGVALPDVVDDEDGVGEQGGVLRDRRARGRCDRAVAVVARRQRLAEQAGGSEGQTGKGADHGRSDELRHHGCDLACQFVPASTSSRLMILRLCTIGQAALSGPKWEHNIHFPFTQGP
jgi:hypothetical protein